MIELLIFIKHRFAFIWNLAEGINNIVFSALYIRRLNDVIIQVFSDVSHNPFSYRILKLADSEILSNIISAQPEEDLQYFHPHGLDPGSVRKQFGKDAFLMMGVFDGNKIVGYFFLRFFFTRKCFVGRLIDKPYRGKGIGNNMNHIMYEIAWRMKFRCLSTISKNNKAVMKAHAKNSEIIILKELQNDYLLVEFIRQELCFSDNKGISN